MKKVLIGVGVVLVLFVLFIWWGSTIEDTPESNNSGTMDTAPVTTQDFTSDKGNFSVYFGGAPEYTPGTLSLKNGDSFATHLYQHRAEDGSVWQVFFTEYPKSADLSNEENFLLNSIKGTESSINGKIVSSNSTKYQGLPAIDYLIYLENEKYYFKGRNILDGRKLYSVVYIYDDGKEVSSEKFFSSFKILK